MISSLYNQRKNTIRPSQLPMVAGQSNQNDIVIRTLPNMSVHLIFSASDTIGEIEWNCNGTLISATDQTSGRVQIFSCSETDWSCLIATGSSGLHRVEWHPTSPQHIFVYSEFNTKMDVWDVIHNQLCVTIQHVVSDIGLVVSNSRTRCLIIVSQPDSPTNLATLVSISDVHECFKVLTRFPLSDNSPEIIGAAWTSNDDGFVTWESPLKSHIIQYDLRGQVVSKIDLYPTIPESVASRPLGVSCVAARRDLLCIGTFTDSVRLFSLRGSLNVLAEFSTKEPTIVISNDSPKVYRETLAGSASVLERNVYYAGGVGADTHGVEYRPVVPDKSLKIEGLSTLHLPVADKTAPIDPKEPPKCGVISASFSPDGRYLSCLSRTRPSTAFIYDIHKMALSHIVIHRLPIRESCWSPLCDMNRLELCIVTGDNRLFIWSPNERNRVIKLKDKSFKPSQAVWTADGSSIIASNQTHSCCIAVADDAPVLGG